MVSAREERQKELVKLATPLVKEDRETWERLARETIHEELEDMDKSELFRYAYELAVDGSTPLRDLSDEQIADCVLADSGFVDVFSTAEIEFADILEGLGLT